MEGRHTSIRCSHLLEMLQKTQGWTGEELLRRRSSCGGAPTASIRLEMLETQGWTGEELSEKTDANLSRSVVLQLLSLRTSLVQ